MSYRVYRSSAPDLELVNLDLLTYIFSNPLRAAPEKPIFVDSLTGIFRTYSDVLERTKSLAHGLRSLGVKAEDVVAFISPNSIDYAITCYAVLGCGATVSPVSAASTSTELQTQLTTSSARFLIAHSSLVDLAEESIRSTCVERNIQAGGQRDRYGQPTAKSLAMTAPPSEFISVSPNEVATRLAFMCFSSDTTGRAKGVMSSHKNVTSNMQQWLAHIPEDWTGRCMSMLTGTTVVVMPKFDFDSDLGNIQKYRPETLVMVPPVVLLLVKDPRVSKYGLKSVKRIMSAAAPLSAELREAVEARRKRLFETDVFCYQAWGATETTPLATAVPMNRPDKKNTVGNLVPNLICRIVDPDNLVDVEVV